jgi:hypothetical protein
MSNPAQTGRSRHTAAMPEQGKETTSAERTRAYRERLRAAGKDRADTPPCLLCGRPITLNRIDPSSTRGQSRTGRALCAPCWRKSDEGRAAERERNQLRKRNRSRNLKETQ